MRRGEWKEELEKMIAGQHQQKILGRTLERTFGGELEWLEKRLGGGQEAGFEKKLNGEKLGAPGRNEISMFESSSCRLIDQRRGGPLGMSHSPAAIRVACL